MTMTPEQLIYDLQKQVIRLEEELKKANEYIEDFVKIGHIWMKAYNEDVPRLKTKVKTLEGAIEQLEKDLLED